MLSIQGVKAWIDSLEYLSKESGLTIIRYIHTETQAGKSLLDAHFGHATRHLREFMKTYLRNRIAKIATAEGLAFALSEFGGMPNSCVQLICHSGEKVKVLSQKYEKLMLSALIIKFLRRQNNANALSSQRYTL